MEPKVSIIMPAFNAARYIAEAIESVKGQRYLNWELIVVNDGSTDATESIVYACIGNDYRIRIVSQQNKKQAAARNSGLKIASGDFITFIDADDLWESEYLNTQVEYLSKFPLHIAYTRGVVLYEESGAKECYPSISGNFGPNEMYAHLNQFNPVPNLGTMFNRTWIDKVGFQNEATNVVGCEDWDYWLRLARAGATFFGGSKALFTYRHHPQGMSRNRNQMTIAEIHVLFNNLDPSMGELTDIKERLVSLISNLLPGLIISKEIKEASDQAEILCRLRAKYNYRILSIYIKSRNSPSLKIVRFLLHPRSIFKKSFLKMPVK